VSIVAALTIGNVVLFFTGFIEELPVAVLGAIVISATLGLFNFEYLKHIYRVNKAEFVIAVFTSLCVITLGVIEALFIAVVLSLGRLLRLSSRPPTEILGKVASTGTYHNVERVQDAVTYPGLMIFRFGASLLFYNADYFSDSIREKMQLEGNELKAVLIDGETLLMVDVSGADMLKEIIESAQKDGIAVLISAQRSYLRTVLKDSGVTDLIGQDKIFYSIDDGVEYYLTHIQTGDNS
jgi:MFS superfamily sulfate permease-like transporter